MMKRFFTMLFAVAVGVGASLGQETVSPIQYGIVPPDQCATVTLEQCQQAARTNFPAVKGYELIDRLAEFNVQNARRNWLPKISLNATVGYLSDVPAVSGDVASLLHQLGIELGTFPEVQYGAAIGVRQTVWDGGTISAGVDAARAQQQLQHAQLEADLYALRQRVDQLYFGSLLLQQRLVSLDMLTDDLVRNCNVLEVMVECGRTDRNDLELLRVELLSVRQQRTEVLAMHDAYLSMLAVMTGLPINHDTTLEMPVVADVVDETVLVCRPELDVLSARGAVLDAQLKAVEASVMPRVFAFVTGAYSNPSPNIFRSIAADGGPKPYVFAGVGLSWNLDGFYTRRNRTSQITLSRHQLEIERDVFLYNTRLQSLRERAAINKMQETIQYDDEIITMRTSIRCRTESRVANAESSVNDLLRDISAEELARQNRLIHEIEWLQAIYELKNTENR